MEERIRMVLDYCERGWSVLPLHYIQDGRCSCDDRNCSSPGKHPMISNGLKGAVSDSDIARRWWAKTPLANIGITTGKKSDLVVLDVDPDHGGEESYQDLVYDHGDFLDTVQVLTGGGGCHYYFRYPVKLFRM